jgi:DNA-binding protein WhiA
MSYAKLVKEELVTLPIDTQAQLAELLAFLHMNGEVQLTSQGKHIQFKTNSPTVAKRFLQIVRSLYQAEIHIIKKEQQALTKKPQIIMDIESKVDDILSEMKLLDSFHEASEELIQTEDAYIAFLRAAFLSSGSVNHPKTAQYHLELSHERDDIAIFIQKLMNHFDLNAKMINRRHQHVIYLKDAEHISDFLMRLGAQNAVFQFEDLRIKRDFNNSINRVMNCEIANEKKVYEASLKQIEDIKTILSYNIHVDEKIKRIMDLRLTYEEANLRELTEYYLETYQEKISKSGLNHRFEKIKQIAISLKEGQPL